MRKVKSVFLSLLCQKAMVLIIYDTDAMKLGLNAL